MSKKTLPITRFDKDEVNRKVMDDCLSTISNMRLTMKEELEEEELTMKEVLTQGAWSDRN